MYTKSNQHRGTGRLLHVDSRADLVGFCAEPGHSILSVFLFNVPHETNQLGIDFDKVRTVHAPVEGFTNEIVHGLRRAVDEEHELEHGAYNRDVQIDLLRGVVEEMVTPEVFARLLALFVESDGTPVEPARFVLRRSHELSKAVDWHRDSRRLTMRVALNTESDCKVGGEFVYSVLANFDFPDRKYGTGTVSVHSAKDSVYGTGDKDWDTQQGTTKLLSGIIYNLYVLSE
jgi:hypothetical protein